MALCSFSSSLSMDGVTMVENTFLSEFLPQAPENAVKVYLYGRFLCQTPHDEDNSLENMSTVLGLSEDEIVLSFSYWQDMGLVSLMAKTPLEVKFLPIKIYSGSSKLRNKEKYAEFNEEAQKIITGRQISPNEYNEYYTLIETYHFEPEALLMIIKYCTMIKNGNINYPYILAVAKNFANEGIKTASALEEKIAEQEQASAEIKAVLSALSIKREADAEERNLYIKWVNSFGFTQSVILFVAKNQGRTGGMHKLDATLTNYFELKLMSIQEIESYAQTRQELYSIAKEVTRTIGQYYQVLDGVVLNYVTNWVNKGFVKETLNQIATYCLATNQRTLEALDETINRFFKLGLVSSEAINQYIEGVVSQNNKIKEVLSACGLLRNVTNSDRELYKTWNNDWHLSHEIILRVAALSKGKDYPISFINNKLSQLFANNITTLEKAEEFLANNPSSNQTKTKQEAQNFSQRTYSSSELSAVFYSIDDIIV